jgi:hypothetical protein
MEMLKIIHGHGGRRWHQSLQVPHLQEDLWTISKVEKTVMAGAVGMKKLVLQQMKELLNPTALGPIAGPGSQTGIQARSAVANHKQPHMEQASGWPTL